MNKTDILNDRSINRFLKYIAVDTQSDEESGLSPSSEKQKDLGRLLRDELAEIGAEDIYYDEEHNYLYAMIPATDGGKSDKVLGFIAHMDTSPEASGANVKPQFIYDYDGGDIGILSAERFPELKKYIGKTLITTDGTTLLGADDKAGIAEIMTMAEELLTDIRSGEPKYMHGRIAIAFTTDEEIGEGTKNFDVKRFGADYAYTVDGGEIGELEFENFNAAAAVVTVKGLNVHPGEAKNKMLNAIRVAEEFDSMIGEADRPEKTEGYEGFFHLMKFSGDVVEARMDFFIRDHSREKFEEKKERLQKIADTLNEKYKAFCDNPVSVDIHDQYYNMRSCIEPDNMFLIENAKKAMEELGIEPKISPIRGGTDGANLSFMGIPCPNLCAGGHNFHGIYEYVPAESVIEITKLLVMIACGE
ncbi:MAG: peptidase T [Eubacterium sp.]|nr:peptidase T [Eubacterium sp.]